jgi:hypothetical protein
MNTRGPTTRFRGPVKAPAKDAPDRVEQSSTAPVGACFHHLADDAQFDVPNATAMAAAITVHAIAVPRRAVTYRCYTDGSTGVPGGADMEEDSVHVPAPGCV